MINKLILFIVLSLGLQLNSALAETYYVDKDGIGGTCNDTNVGTIDAPWCNIDKANKTLAAGDTVYIRSGTYSIGNLVIDGGSVDSQGIRPSNNGTSENPITYSSYPGEIVAFTGVRDGTGLRAVAIGLDGKSFIHVTGGSSGYGMTFDNMTMNVQIGYNTKARNIEIDHCDFGGFIGTYGDDPGPNYKGIYIGHGSQYNHIHDNSIHDWQYFDNETDGPVCLEIGEEQIDSSTFYNVIENNKIYHCGHHVVGLNGQYTIFRNNALHNENYYDIGGTLYGYRNLLTNGYGHSLIEGNRFGAAGISKLSTDSVQRGGTSVYLNSSNNILRQNYIYSALGMAMNFRKYGMNVNNNTVYNNTFYHSGYSTEDDINCNERFPIHFTSDNATTMAGNCLKNNLLHSTWPQTTTDPQQSGCGARPIDPAWYGAGSSLSYQTIANNSQATGLAASYFTNADVSDENSTILPDLSLIASAAVIDAASYLTQANGSGSSSTTLVVDDAKYFQDGNFGLGTLSWPSSVSIQADWIAIGTVSNVVQISSIDYATNTITLASAMTWADDAPIWLYKKSDGTRVLYGSAPDYGAYEYDSTPVGQVTGSFGGNLH